MQSIFVVVQALALLWASGIGETRQIRINRYAASVQEDDLLQAEVRELKPTPYPAAGYRPQGRSFLLPGEDENVEGSGYNSDQATTTTESYVDDNITSTTDALDLSTTTSLPTTTTSPLDTIESTTTTAPATKEFRSGRAFAKAPYPAAGYRPSQAFLLPTELKMNPAADALQESTPESATESNVNHPVCGVSTNPLMPTPEPGSKAEPDAESVVITANLGPAVLVARAPSSAVIPMAIPLRSQPLIYAPRRGFVYSTRVGSPRNAQT